jgi:hypothetical protein
MFGGRVYEEWLPELVGDRAIRVYKEMYEQDPTVGAMLFAVEMLIRGVDWEVAPANETPEAEHWRAFCESCLYDMEHTWEDTLSEILSFLPYGWALLEEVYKLRHGDQADPEQNSRFQDGLVGWRKLSIRAQDTLLRWEESPDGSAIGMWQMAPPFYKATLIPFEKSMLFRTRPRKDNPQGWSVLRSCYRPWYFKSRIENLEGIGVERDLAGLPVAYVPPELLAPNPSANQAATLAAITKVVTNIRRDEQEGLVFPLAYDETGKLRYDLKLLTTGGERQFDTSAIIQRYDQRILMTMMADFLLLGSQQVGSFALSTDKTQLFSAAIGAYMDSIAAVVTEQGFTRLMRLNGAPMEMRPTLTHGDIESANLNDLGNYIRNLTASGMELFPDDDVERFVKEQAHLPVPETDTEEQDSSRSARSGPRWDSGLEPTPQEPNANKTMPVVPPGNPGPPGPPGPPGAGSPAGQ